jgi:tungstate transport system ATP-binding protein
MTTPVYRLQSVSKKYNGRKVLDIEALDIEQGEIFGIVGPSGAGKSTLLRLLNFLERPSAGSITYRTMRLDFAREIPLGLRRQVTTVFQRPVLLNRDVSANVSFGLQLRRTLNAAQETRRALRRVGLSEMAHQPARKLSGGEAQRVALARAIALQPHVLLLDEPTANLDPFNVSVVESVLRDLNREQQTTMVLVTHNLFQARRLAHRVALLLEGQVIEVAEKEQFFEAPGDQRTRAFVTGELVY